MKLRISQGPSFSWMSYDHAEMTAAQFRGSNIWQRLRDLLGSKPAFILVSYGDQVKLTDHCNSKVAISVNRVGVQRTVFLYEGEYTLKIEDAEFKLVISKE